MKKLSFIMIGLFILTGCDQKPSEQKEQKVGTEVIQNSHTGFKTEIPLGTSLITGIAIEHDSYLNFNDMETGLMELAKKYIDVNKNIYSPGKVLTPEDVNGLLARTGADFPDGLNPKLTSKPSESPLYINTIVEQDYFTYDENKGKKINTIAIGAGIDRTYEYDENKDPHKITDDEIINFITPYLANAITEYIHNKEGYEDVNIVFGLFEESEDGILPGSYFTYGYIPSGENQLPKVEKTNVNYLLFPNNSGDHKNVNEIVSEIQTKVNNYFTEYSGQTAIAKFENDEIIELHILITINVYSQIDAETFTQYIVDLLKGINTQGIPKLEINIKSSSNESIAILVYEGDELKVNYVYRKSF